MSKSNILPELQIASVSENISNMTDITGSSRSDQDVSWSPKSSECEGKRLLISFSLLHTLTQKKTEKILEAWTYIKLNN